MDNKIVVIYKEVGKKPIFTKAENNIEYFKNKLEGEVETISYENIFIICKKNRERLNPNVFVNKSFGKFDSNIRGNIFLVAQENNEFISLTKEQALQYFNFLQRESFNYKHFDENGKYLSTNELRQRNRKRIELEKQQEYNKENDFITIVPVSDSSRNMSNNETNKNNYNNNYTTEQTLALILKIQNTILEFIKNYAETNNTED